MTEQTTMTPNNPSAPRNTPKGGNTPGKRRRMPFFLKVLLPLLALFLIAGVVLFVFFKKQTNPDNIVSEYLSVFMSKDSGSLFRHLDFEENEWITADAFAKCMEECHKYSTISTYGLTKYADTKDQIQYRIEYWNNTHGNPYTQTLVLNSVGKQHLFFDDWKIDNSEFLAKNYTVSIPAGAGISFDGIAVSQEQLIRQENYLDTYQLQPVFIGSHEITVNLKGFKAYSSQVTLENLDYSQQSAHTITTSMLKVTKKTKSTLSGQAEKLITAIYKGMLKETAYDKLAKKYDFEGNRKLELEKKYDDLIEENIHPTTHLTGVEFTRCQSSFSSSSYAEDGCYAVAIITDVDYMASSLVENTISNSEGVSTGISRDEKTTDGSSTFTTTFHYLDGKWYVHETTVLDNCIYYMKY